MTMLEAFDRKIVRTAAKKTNSPHILKRGFSETLAIHPTAHIPLDIFIDNKHFIFTLALKCDLL